MRQERRLVLIVDDDECVLGGVQRALGQHGYQVRTCANPLEAEAMVDALRPPVVLTDTVMPGLDGLELTRRIRAMGYATQVIVMTAHIEPIKIIEAYTAGASDFALKPLRIEELPEVLDRGFERYLRWRSVMVAASRERTAESP